MSSLTKLNDALFASLDALANAKPDKLESEIERAKAVAGVADRIISNSRTMLDAATASQEMGVQSRKILPQLGLAGESK